MSQFLPRGLQVLPNIRIKKIAAEDILWQIYETNTDSYVLAVEKELYNRWVKEFDLPSGIFSYQICPEYMVYAASGTYLISSLEQGPYPTEMQQIEAFSGVFKKALEQFDRVSFHDAVYIEEYSLLLPVSAENHIMEAGAVYGRWLTGGVNISIGSFQRVCKLMSWMPQEILLEYARIAGFDIDDMDSIQTETAEKTKTTVRENDPEERKALPIKANQRFTLTGRPELEQFFNDNIIDIVEHQDEYERMGIKFPGATILYGPPGCGKTYAVERLAEYLGWQRFDIDASTIASSYIHDTSKKISEMFKAAMDAAPSILVIDEMEAFLSDREAAASSGTHHVEEVAEFLRRIPEAVSRHVLIFAMTNMIDSIDPAILRKGRFDYMIEVKMATAQEIEMMLREKFAALPVEKDIEIPQIAEALAGHPLSDVAFVLREAGRYAVKNKLDQINNQCFDAAVDLLPKKETKRPIGFL